MNPATNEKPVVLRPPTKVSAPSAPAPPPKPLFLDCQIETMPNGEGVAQIVIRADIMKRLKNRAQGTDLNRFVWDNVLKAALESYVY